jgi:hypothetical protein
VEQQAGARGKLCCLPHHPFEGRPQIIGRVAADLVEMQQETGCIFARAALDLYAGGKANIVQNQIEDCQLLGVRNIFK